MTTVWFNGYKLNDYFRVAGIDRPMPEFELSTTEAFGVDGELFDDLSLRRRELSLSLMVRNVTKREMQDKARELMGILKVSKPTNLRISDEKDPDGTQLVRYAVPVGAIQVEELPNAARWTVNFEQPDPFLYGKSRSMVLKANQYWRGDAGGGMPAWWTLTVDKPRGAEYYYFHGESTGGAVEGETIISFYAPFNGTGKLTANCKAHTVKMSPALAGASGLTTQTRFAPLCGKLYMLSNMKATVSWRETWA